MADQSKLSALIKQVEALIEQCVEEANRTGEDFRISLVGGNGEQYDVYSSVFAVEYMPYTWMALPEWMADVC
jgi:UDP:flavonoid glycosyltransferase YjiC (YdhE family)